jgi:hypothetical protein
VPLDSTLLSWLVLVALVLATAALGLAWYAARTAMRGNRVGPPRRPRAPRRGKTATTEPATLTTAEATAEIEALKVSTATALRHLAVVRYDAFGDMGGHLSWSMALLDDAGDGVVLTSIHGRSDARTYAKNVTAWSASQQLSPEEDEAISYAHHTSG